MKLTKIPKEILRKAKQGNKEAIEYLIDSVTPLIHYMSMNYLKDYGHAEDCTQFVLEILIKNIIKYDEEVSKFNTWFYKVVNSNIKFYMRDYYFPTKSIELDEKVVYNAKEEIDNEYQKQIQMENKLSKIEKYLGKEDYHLLMLKIGYGLSFKKIGNQINLEYHQVKRRFHIIYSKAKEYARKLNEKENR